MGHQEFCKPFRREHKTVPFHNMFELKTKRNEPRNAFIFTSLIILVALILGSLNALATLITLFFLITYGMLNLVVFLQQSMKMISFRPTFKIPQFVSFFGALGCIFIMFLINPVFSAVATRGRACSGRTTRTWTRAGCARAGRTRRRACCTRRRRTAGRRRWCGRRR